MKFAKIGLIILFIINIIAVVINITLWIIGRPVNPVLFINVILAVGSFIMLTNTRENL
jgi:hypothetical protein